METSRDDLVIAIRSAFLKKGAQQKFSLFALLIISIVLIFIETLDTKPLNIMRSIFKDGIIKIASVAQFPNKIFFKTNQIIDQHFSVYKENKHLKIELNKFKKIDLDNSFLQAENNRLRIILGDQSEQKFQAILSKVILDTESPYLKSIIINKGLNHKVRKGMPVIFNSNLVGLVVDVNFLSSRVLLLKDLNSKIPVIIQPEGYLAILSGKGDSKPILEFLPENNNLQLGNIIYTSGKDGIIPPGIAVGEVNSLEANPTVNLFSKSDQLSFVNVLTTEVAVTSDF